MIGRRLSGRELGNLSRTPRSLGRAADEPGGGVPGAQTLERRHLRDEIGPVLASPRVEGHGKRTVTQRGATTLFVRVVRRLRRFVAVPGVLAVGTVVGFDAESIAGQDGVRGEALRTREAFGGRGDRHGVTLQDCQRLQRP